VDAVPFQGAPWQERDVGIPAACLELLGTHRLDANAGLIGHTRLYWYVVHRANRVHESVFTVLPSPKSIYSPSIP